MRLNMANNIINLDRKRNRRSRANSARWEKMDRCVLCWHLTNVPQNTLISHENTMSKDRDSFARNATTSFASKVRSLARTM